MNLGSKLNRENRSICMLALTTIHFPFHFGTKLCLNADVPVSLLSSSRQILNNVSYITYINHIYVNHIFSDCIELLGLIRSITLHFSSLECMLRLYITVVRSKIEYASVISNSITSTDANKLERIQQRFAALCFKRFFNPEVPYCYSFVFEQLKLLTLRVRRHRLDAFFLTQVYSGSKF
jgi:hypothetical protein